MPKRIKNEVLESEDGSLYNIYSISFNNIKEPASIVEFGRQLDRLEKLENRIRDLTEDFKNLGRSQLSLFRRSFTSHSEIKLILKQGNQRSELSFDHEELKDYLDSLSEIDQKHIRTFETEITLLNANLKIEWTRFFEFAKAASIDEKSVIQVKNFPKYLDRLQQP